MRHRTVRRERAYAAIPNAAMRDEALSIDARGMLALLMTYADEWVFRSGHLMKVAQVGRDKFQRIMRELRDAGYVQRVPTRDDDGRVSGSAWMISDAPDYQSDGPDDRQAELPIEVQSNRQPEKPVVGATEDRENRQPGKPTAGFSGPIRRTRDKKKKRKENAGARDLTPDAFKRFWGAHPKVRDREGSEGAFSEAVKSGVDPELIVAAAERYRAENKREAGLYLCPSDDWLRQQRWKAHGGSNGQSKPPANADDVVSFWAKKINQGGYVPSSAIKPDVVRAMLYRELVTKDQLRKCGVAV